MRTPLLAAVAALGLAAPAGAAAPALKVFPPAVELRGQEDRQSLVVQLVDAQGTTKDVTASAKLTFADAAVAALAGRTLSPKKDGATTLLVEADGLRAEVAVKVTDAQKARAVSFRLDVMPVFMKHGCNNGSCHGAARGKDGFRLSLFGFDPA
ncbi:MAG: cell surface protein, partial [Gemmata sp.]